MKKCEICGTSVIAPPQTENLSIERVRYQSGVCSSECMTILENLLLKQEETGRCGFCGHLVLECVCD